MMKKIYFVIYCVLLTTLCNLTMASISHPPKDFVYLHDIAPDIIESPRYTTSDNFLGRPVPGYTSQHIVCTKKLALALKKINTELKAKGYRIVVYDAYRPQTAVNAFIAWSHDPHDQTAKPLYYPYLDKARIFPLGYLRKHSGHSRGSTVDLTLIPLDSALKPIQIQKRRLRDGENIAFLNDNTVDMGSSFDLFHDVSHHGTHLITPEQTHMRLLLKNTMEAHGFKPVSEEWWHYTLQDEPYPDTYFDFSPNALNLNYNTK